MITTVGQRGTKRTCQDEACGERFYDLMKTTIACPVCGAAFTPPPPPVPRQVGYRGGAQRRPSAVAFGQGRPAAAAPPLEAAATDGDEIADEIADDVAEMDGEADDTGDDKTASILELDDDDGDTVEPVVPTDKDSE